MDEVSLNEALQLFKYPRILGLFENKELSVNLGRFGPYVKHNNNFVSIKDYDLV